MSLRQHPVLTSTTIRLLAIITAKDPLLKSTTQISAHITKTSAKHYDPWIKSSPTRRTKWRQGRRSVPLLCIFFPRRKGGGRKKMEMVFFWYAKHIIHLVLFKFYAFQVLRNIIQKELKGAAAFLGSKLPRRFGCGFLIYRGSNMIH